jgi:hypothetical protein
MFISTDVRASNPTMYVSVQISVNLIIVYKYFYHLMNLYVYNNSDFVYFYQLYFSQKQLPPHVMKATSNGLLNANFLRYRIAEACDSSL